MNLRRRLVIIVATIVGLAIVGAGWFAVIVINTALEAEGHLNATKDALDITDQYVAAQGDWPRSWDALKGFKVRRADEFPANIDWLRACVDFDFSVQLDSINTKDVSAFVAIKPKPPYYSAYSTSLLQLLETVAKQQQKKSGAAE